jgi:WD40 repeat protein
MNLNLKQLSSGHFPISNILATEHSGQPALLAIDSKGSIVVLDSVLGIQHTAFQLEIDWPITSSTIVSGKLVAGGSDGNIMLFDFQTKRVIYRDQLCQGALVAITKATGDLLMIGSDDGKIFYCRSEPFKIEKVLELGMAVLFMHQLSDKQLFLILESNILAIVNPTSGDIEHTSKIGHSPITSAYCADGVLFFGCTYGNLYRLDLKTHLKDSKTSKLLAKKVHSSWILSMKLSRNFLITTGDDNLVVVWNPNTLDVLFTAKNHSNSVQAAEEVDGTLFTASHDGSIMFESLATLNDRIKAAEESRLAEQKQRELELEKEKGKKKKQSKGGEKAKIVKKK